MHGVMRHIAISPPSPPIRTGLPFTERIHEEGLDTFGFVGAIAAPVRIEIAGLLANRSISASVTGSGTICTLRHRRARNSRVRGVDTGERVSSGAASVASRGERVSSIGHL